MKVLNIDELKKKTGMEGSTDSDQIPSTSTQSNSAEIAENIEKESLKAIKKYAIYFLSRREYSYQELLHKFEVKEYDLTLSERVLSQLKESGLQSDQRFTDMFIRSRIAKLSGPFKLRMELKQKGISATLIDQSIGQLDCDWFELALSAATKKADSWKSFEAKEKSKLIRFLQGRGFEQEQIRYATEQLDISHTARDSSGS